jgi:5'-nucleotidase
LAKPEATLSARPLILLSNDDGVHAQGLHALRAALAEQADVFVVAPEHEQSATSHRITLAGPLRHTEHEAAVHSVDGTPADCVYIALNLKGLLPRRPDLVVSGINHGLNLAQDVFYSGTVAAAREGALRGVRAAAISAERGADLALVARHSVALLSKVIALQVPAGQQLLLNVNFPQHAPKGIVTAKLGRREYEDVVEARIDPRGRSYYWIGGPAVSHDGREGADTTLIDAGYATVTPLSLEMTHSPYLELAQQVVPHEGEP